MIMPLTLRHALLLSCEALLFFLARQSFAFGVVPRLGTIRSMAASGGTTTSPFQSRQQQSIWQSLPLASDSNIETDQDSSKPKIRFSGIDLDRSNKQKSPVDLFFSSLTSDVTSIALGTIGLLILLVGRLILDNDDQVMTNNVDALGQATRVNLLSVFGCGSILLNGVSKLDIQSAMAERVQLIGVQQPEPVLVNDASGGDDDDDDDANSSTTTATSWVLESLLRASPASSVVLLQASAPSAPWQIQGFVGIVPENLTKSSSKTTTTTTALLSTETPILDRLRREDTESYLPTLQALPGRVEFEALLPVNTQAVLLLPVVDGGRRMAVVLGANQARSFTPRDIAWCQVVANRLAQ